MKLIIVESPNKAKTISKFIDREYKVMASVGHIRNLPGKEIGVDLTNNFRPKWVVEKGKNSIIKDIKDAASRATVIYIATDPDREGESIAWHLIDAAKLPVNKIMRAYVHELTEKAVMKAIKEATPGINKKYAEAGVARRIEDRIIGFIYSPFLMFNRDSDIRWQIEKRPWSFGRVQTPTLKIVVDREREIRNFKPEKYFTVEALLSKDSVDFKSDYEKGKKFKTKEEAQKIVDATTGHNAIVVDFKEEVKKVAPPAPLTTSELLKTANKVYGYKSEKTMQLAQNLFETGYISYHRTDTKHLSDETKGMVSKYIKRKFGDKYLSSVNYSYRKQAGAQEAHESIHPIDIDVEQIKLGGDKKLTEDHNKIYRMIHAITTAALMSQQEVKVKSVVFDINKNLFHTSGKQVLFDGYTRIWGNSSDDQLLPELKKGDSATNKKISLMDKETKPPARYNEASLIKKMETLNIGRPSTYAAIISNISDRGYIKYVAKNIFPTPDGEKLITYCEKRLPKFMDYKFTGDLEQGLDEIMNGKINTGTLLNFTFTEMKKELNMTTEDILRMTAPRK